MLFKLVKSKELARPDASPHSARIVSFDALTANDGNYDRVTIDPDEDVAVLQYTGGTTGVPKGAMLTHSNLSINQQQADLWEPGVEKGTERIMAILPFFHVFAMTTIMNRGIANAAMMILLPRFDVAMALKIIRETKPTIMPGVPTLFNALRNYPKLKPEDLKSLRSGVSGGAPLPVELKRNFEKEAGVIIVEGYGLSETSPIATCNPLEGPVKEGSIGLPVPRTQISLRSLDDPAQEVPLGEKGEICIAGPQVMKGYWNKPQETEAVFVGEFFRTGDVAVMDEDGFIYIVDRIKDLILCSGYNVYPRRIEEAIYQYPAVEEVSVIGIPDEYRGEAPKAFIKLREGQSATESEILKFLEPKLSKIEMPAEIEFRDALPKTMIGKLSKKELRAEVQGN
jgi:long-chain acyl-CoA synthetase